MAKEPIIGSYRIKKQISEGGFGIIYQAEHVLLGEKACIKQNKEASQIDIDILFSEAKMLWKLEDYHSIPKIKDIYRIDKYDCAVVMSFIDGLTLDDTVKNNSRLHPEDACWVTERLLGALYYCHYYGVVHTDIKPANVFVEPKKRDIKLIDFGLAAYKPDGKTVPLGYTQLYAAPELLDGKPPIPETDIYGAGMVLLYALGGDPARKTLPADVPDQVADFCNRLIKFDPNERPNWKKNNPLEDLSEIRQAVFGRRHIE